MVANKKVYDVQDLIQMLGLSRASAYRFVKKAYENQGPFKVVKLGSTYRIVATSFDKWLEEA